MTRPPNKSSSWVAVQIAPEARFARHCCLSEQPVSKECVTESTGYVHWIQRFSSAENVGCLRCGCASVNSNSRKSNVGRLRSAVVSSYLRIFYSSGLYRRRSRPICRLPAKADGRCRGIDLSAAPSLRAICKSILSPCDWTPFGRTSAGHCDWAINGIPDRSSPVKIEE